MSAVLIGFLIVVASAALFGYALFGRRPLPQPATQPAVSTRVPTPTTETPPSGVPRRPISTEPPRSGGERSTATATARSGEPPHPKSSDVGVPMTRRLRSLALLAVSVVGTALLVGAILSILVVGAVLLVA